MKVTPKNSNPVSQVCTLFGAKKHTTKKISTKKTQFVRYNVDSMTSVFMYRKTKLNTFICKFVELAK